MMCCPSSFFFNSLKEKKRATESCVPCPSKISTGTAMEKQTPHLQLQSTQRIGKQNPQVPHDRSIQTLSIRNRKSITVFPPLYKLMEDITVHTIDASPATFVMLYFQLFTSAGAGGGSLFGREYKGGLTGENKVDGAARGAHIYRERGARCLFSCQISPLPSLSPFSCFD